MKNEKTEKMDCMFQQEQAVMSTTENDALVTHKECLYLHQPPQQRKMLQQNYLLFFLLFF